jgi:transposase
VLPAEQDRPGVARRRARWKKYQVRIDPARLVFIDETWVKTNMAPIRGWCARGRRLAAKVPHGHWKTMTFLAALRCDRIEAPWVLDGPINGESFRTYVDQVLAPTLKPGDVVILDNLGSHKGKAVRRAIRASGARLLFLPPYSPDLHRTGLRQTETSHTKGQGANRRRYLETHRLIARNLQIQRMQKLPRQCRLRFILK